MALVDTTDGVFMVGPYGWTFANPVRKFWYNLTITGDLSAGGFAHWKYSSPRIVRGQAGVRRRHVELGEAFERFAGNLQRFCDRVVRR